MTDSNIPPPANESADSVDDAIAEYLRWQQAGRAVDHAEWIASHPRWTQELTEFLETYQQMQRYAAKLSTNRQALMHWASPGMRIRYVGDYEIMGPVGQGGMGVVYKARQISLDRIVALKMIVDREHDAARFKREAETAAGLDHPHILPIYEIGEHDGWPYYSMPLVEGGDLRQRMNPPMNDQSAARVVGKLARAVDYAHRRGVLHRDLKPANVLLDERGEPHITDFGLCKLLNGLSHRTRSGSILGTPAYMSPEQASGKGREITTSTDVYGLGAVLYSLLTGLPPFQAEHSLAILRCVECDPPVPPRSIRAEISADLNTLCLKCLEKDPQARYDSADSLADDLDRFIRGEPVIARPINSGERVWRWARRNPALAALAISTTCLLLVMAIGGPWLAAREILASRSARESRAEAQLSKEQANARLVDSFVNNGHRVRTRWEWGEAHLWFASAANLAIDEHQQTTNVIRAEGLRTTVPQPIWAAMFPGDCPRTLEFHPSGQFLLCGDGRGTCVLWDLTGGNEPPTMGDGVRCAVWSPDGTKLATATLDGSVGLFDDHADKSIWNAKLPEGATCLAFDPQGERLVAGCGNSVVVWSLADDRQDVSHTVMYVAAAPISHIAFNRSGDRLLVQGPDAVILLDVSRQAATPLAPLFEPVPHRPIIDPGEAYPVRAQFLGDDSFLTVQDRKVVLHDAITGQPREDVDSGRPHSLSVNPLGTAFLVGGDSTARMWHARASLELASFRGRHREPVVAADFHPLENVIATGGLDGQVRLWLSAETKPKVQITHPIGVAAIRFSPDGQLLATAQTDGLVRVWKIDQRAFSVPHRTGEVAMGKSSAVVALAPDGVHWFVSQCEPDSTLGGKFQLYSMTGEVSLAPLILDGLLCSADMSRAGDRLATVCVAVGSDRADCGAEALATTVRFWQWPSREPLEEGVALPAPSSAIAFRPDGRQLAILTKDGDMRLLDVKSPVEVKKLPMETSPPGNMDPRNAGLKYTRDGSRLIGWNGGNRVSIWSADTGQSPYDPLVFTHACTCVDLSADEQWLATSTSGGEVRVWNFITGRPVSKPIAHPDRVNSVRFSPNGRWLLTTCGDGHVRTIAWRDGGKVLRSFNVRTDAFDALFFPSGQWFVTASDYNPITVHDARDGQLMLYLGSQPHLAGTDAKGRRIRLSFSPDGRYLLSAGGASVRIFGLGWLQDIVTTDHQRLQRESELSSGKRIVDGSATPILSRDWLNAWREFER